MYKIGLPGPNKPDNCIRILFIRLDIRLINATNIQTPLVDFPRFANYLVFGSVTSNRGQTNFVSFRGFHIFVTRKDIVRSPATL